MSTYTQILYHLVFGTKNHRAVLELEKYDQLRYYITGIIRNKKCVPYAINGFTEHIHLLFDLHPSVSLSNFVKDLKLATSQWIKEKKIFPCFDGWQEGYGAFTCSFSIKNSVLKYISEQQEHHKRRTFKEEYIDFLKRSGIEFDEKYIS